MIINGSHSNPSSIAMIIVVLLLCISCNSDPCCKIRDADGDCLLEYTSDTISGKVIYFFKEQDTISFDYYDVVEFSHKESLSTYLSHIADIMYGEDRPEYGYSLLCSVLFNTKLDIEDVRLISKIINKQHSDEIIELIKKTEGCWDISRKDIPPQTHYLKFVWFRLY